MAKTETGGAGETGSSEVIALNANGRPGVRKKRSTEVPDENWQAFLDHLAMTCNAKGAARAAGLDHSTAYRRRDRDAAFRAQWEGAIETGMVTLRMMLVARAMGTHGYEPGEDFAPDPATMDPVLGVQMLAQYEKARAAANGRGGVQGGSALPVRVATEDEACDEILKRLKVLNIRLNNKAQ